MLLQKSDFFKCVDILTPIILIGFAFESAWLRRNCTLKGILMMTIISIIDNIRKPVLIHTFKSYEQACNYTPNAAGRT